MIWLACDAWLQLELRKTRAEAARAEMLLKMADEKKRQDEAKRRYDICISIYISYNIYSRNTDILQSIQHWAV